jgi:type I restriction enzyme S subunit
MKYSQYKESGIDWIDVIPEHWETKMFKGISYMKGRIGWQGLKFSEFSDDVTLPYLITGMNFKDGKIRWDEVYHISEERYNEAPEIQLKDYDILMTKDGTIGKLLYIDNLPGKASLNSHLLLLRPLLKSYFPKFLYYQLQSSVFFGHIEYYKYGTTFYGLSQESMGKFITILPSYSEQTAIAQYLDRKTTAVDKKIEILQQKIETYKKLRKAIINKAVTKGLDDKETNKKWKLQRVKDLVVICNGKDYKEVQSDDGKYDVFGSGGAFEKSTEFIYDKPSVLLGRKGTIDKPILVEKPFWAVDTMFYSKMKAKTDAKFFYYFTTTIEFGFYEYGSALPSITQNDLNRILLYFPQIKEQRQIAEYLDQKTATIDKIVENLQTQIATLQHLRKVLINDAVTGKIKVV